MSGKESEAISAVVSIPPATALAQAFPPTLLTRSNPWRFWADLALDHYVTTRRMRVMYYRYNLSNKGHLAARALYREMKAALVVIVSAAIAIDAWYEGVKSRTKIPSNIFARWDAEIAGRRVRIWDTLNLGFSFGREMNHLGKELRWLYGTRDKAVHSEAEEGPFVPHPAGTNTAPITARFCRESALRASRYLVDLLSACQRAPKNRELAAFIQAQSKDINKYRLRLNRLESVHANS